MFAIAFPSFEPIIFEIGPFALRWYAVMWLTGLFVGVAYIKRLVQKSPTLMTPAQVEDFMIWVLLGTIIGGRLGYVLFYAPMQYLADPISIIKTWQGGMSFHGGMLGVILAIMLFARRYKLNQWYVADGVGCAVPIGIGLVRLANFINGELWGRPAPDLPWAMVYPDVDPIPRHPSPLYEALLEGLVLFAVMWMLAQRQSIRTRPGTLTGCFLVGYGLARIVAEFFREPDDNIGFLVFGATMGQLLSLPMVLFGIYCIARAKPISVKA